MTTPVADRRWYVVETHPHAEARAAAHLGRQGFETYLPRYAKRRRHARRTEVVAAPLFPRYLFVAIDMAAQRWRAIKSTFGVARLVGANDMPDAVADGIVAELKQREGEDGLIRLAFPAALRAGVEIRVVTGIFEGCLGLCEGMADHERVAILLDLLGRKVRIVLGAAAVAAA